MLKMIMILLAINSVNSFAQTSTPSCGDITKKCDEALEKKNEVIKQQNIVLHQAEHTIDRLAIANSDKTNDLQKPYRNPFLMGATGATVGLLIGNPVVIVVGFIVGLIF